MQINKEKLNEIIVQRQELEKEARELESELLAYPIINEECGKAFSNYLQCLNSRKYMESLYDPTTFECKIGRVYKKIREKLLRISMIVAAIFIFLNPLLGEIILISGFVSTVILGAVEDLHCIYKLKKLKESEEYHRALNIEEEACEKYYRLQEQREKALKMHHDAQQRSKELRDEIELLNIEINSLLNELVKDATLISTSEETNSTERILSIPKPTVQ